MPAPDPAALDPLLEAEELRERGLARCLGAVPVVLEIGFGRADLLLELAQAHPERGYLGVEVSRKRALKAARRVTQRGLQNVRLVHATAEFLLERVIPAGSISECWINFPDPWPKRRHHKRRLFQPPIVALLARSLVRGARLHVATDHAGYAAWIHRALRPAPELCNMNRPAPWSRERPERGETRYEADWLAEGRAIAYFEYQRT